MRKLQGACCGQGQLTQGHSQWDEQGRLARTASAKSQGQSRFKVQMEKHVRERKKNNRNEKNTVKNGSAVINSTNQEACLGLKFNISAAKKVFITVRCQAGSHVR